MSPILEDSLTLPILLCVLGAALAWVVGCVCLVVAAVRRPGPASLWLAGGAFAQLVGGPLSVGVAYWSAVSWTRRFGAEAMAGAWLAQLAPAALVIALVVVATDAVAVSVSAGGRARTRRG